MSMSDHPSCLTPHASGGVFVTGTDTGVGKTVVTAALARALKRHGLRVGVMKPVETGIVPGDAHTDSMRLRQAADVADPSELIGPYRLVAPLAPLAAAEAAGIVIDVPLIEKAFRRLAGRYPVVLVEGVGGIRVPIAEKVDVLDLIQLLGLPTVVVGRAALGGINHALLTVERLQARGLPVLALVLNRPVIHDNVVDGSVAEEQMHSTVSLLRRLSGVLILGPIPHLPSIAHTWDEGVGQLAQHDVIQHLVDLVRSGV
jgi:dethiobiotin synthetase